MMVIGGFGAGGVLVHDPLLTNSPLGFWRYGHGRELAAMLIYGGVGLMVWAWVRLGRDVLAHRVRGRAVLTTAAVWTAPMLVAPPLFTRDVFSYLAQGALPLAGFDPYAVGPEAMPGIFTDNVHYFWQDTPAPYGPLFILIAKAVAWATGDAIILGVVLMRLALLPGLLLFVWALPELTRRLGGRVPVALWVAVANPLMVIHMVGGGHNDLLVVGLLAAGALVALRGGHVAGIALVTVAMAVKASAAIALPFLVLVWAGAAVRLAPGPRIAKAIAAGVGVFVVVFAGVHARRRGRARLAARAERPVDDRQLDVDPHRGRRVRAHPGRLDRRRARSSRSSTSPGCSAARCCSAIAVPAVVGRARRRAGRRAPGRHRAAGGGRALPRHAALVRELGDGAARGRRVVGARGWQLAVFAVADADDRLLPQRRGRALQLPVPRSAAALAAAAAPRSRWSAPDPLRPAAPAHWPSRARTRRPRPSDGAEPGAG